VKKEHEDLLDSSVLEVFDHFEANEPRANDCDVVHLDLQRIVNGVDILLAAESVNVRDSFELLGHYGLRTTSQKISDRMRSGDANRLT